MVENVRHNGKCLMFQKKIISDQVKLNFISRLIRLISCHSYRQARKKISFARSNCHRFTYLPGHLPGHFGKLTMGSVFRCDLVSGPIHKTIALGIDKVRYCG